MGQSIAPIPSHDKEFSQQEFASEYSPHLNELKSELCQECKYLIGDPNQLLGMVLSLKGFYKFGDEHFKKAYDSVLPLIQGYAEKKNEDPAYKIDPLEKQQIQTAGEVLGNIAITLSQEDFKEGISNSLEFLLEELGTEKKTPQLLAKLTGTVSALCSLPCFARDPGMNDLFFDISTYTMGDVSAVSVPQITESVNNILKTLEK